ncbi:MAG: autotransporter-associated beta strand repeat-containing protein [Paludibacter sp.]|nr:autotransporter-associated beta strand repeat-containing protein [Paludibacter sp.]
MKKHLLFFAALFFICNILFVSELSAQRTMEKLSRSVVAQKVPTGMFVNWRITSDEWYNTSYKLYRDGNLIHETGTSGASNYLDTSGTQTSVYTVVAVKSGVQSAPSAPATVLSGNFLEIPLRDLKKLGKNGYLPNDATAADLDGDGEMEVILKRLKKDWSSECNDFTYFEAYKLDGTFLWAIDVGPNITMDVEINIAAFDFDGDGKAEVFMRSSDNTVFGLDINNENGVSVGDRDKDGYTNYRKAPFNGIGGDGFMNAGPEYLSLIDGETGREIDWVHFIARGSSSDWGDNYGHRSNKFFFGAPYLDGQKPSLFIGRGIYTQTKMRTYDIVNKKLVARWSWESGNGGAYFGQGNHNYTVADTDGDGKDEIVWGSMCIDDDGKGLYSTGMGHGDAIHVSDFDPYRKGTEVFTCLENSPVYGTLFRDGKTGQVLYHHILGRDCGRACAANITDTYKGAELWGGGIGLAASKLVPQQNFGLSENFSIYWDGDLTKELLDHSGFSSGTGVGYGNITKFNSYGNISTLLNANAYSCNYSKGTPSLQADLMGDWREEAMWWRPDSMALRIYSTNHPTTHRIYTLLHDHQYRQAICWQMCGYNQPPHTSFYLGSDFPTPIPAKSTNGKFVWKGSSADFGAANWMDGDNLAALIAGTATLQNYADGKQLLLDTRGTNRNLTLNSNVAPELLMASGTADYAISGNGAFTGNMRLDKLGEGSLTLNGSHSFSGQTEVWEGLLSINGTLSNSNVMVRRHAALGVNGTLGQNVQTEYNASLYAGGKDTADTLTIAGNLNLVEGSKLILDLSNIPDQPDYTVTGTGKNDLLVVNGTLTVAVGANIDLILTTDSLGTGKYKLMTVNQLTGDLSKIKVQGSKGRSVELSYSETDKAIYLVVKGTRSAAKVEWSGVNSSVWDISKTMNWRNNVSEDFFVTGDSVIFNNNASRRTISISENISPAYVEFNHTGDYILAGTASITGATELYKRNSGRLTINNRNSYSGKTVVEAGTLVVKYAPTSANNGGIGANGLGAGLLVVRDSATLQFSTANEISTRGLTVAGESGGVFNTPVNITWNGSITGTKLTKTGTAALMIGASNSTLNETVLRAGTMKLNTTTSVEYGPGKKITMLGGTLETMNSSGAYLTSRHNIDVPEGATATLVAGARCEYNGALTGAGTLNWSVDFIRTYINGNWSAFSGRINLLANGANSTYENKFIVNTTAGFPNATININSGVIMCYKNGTADNGTTTIKTGMLTGVAGAQFYNAGLETGSNNSSGTFAGIISGSSNVKKVGTGTWLLSGANTYTGSTTVSEGTMSITGSVANTTITVQSGANLNLLGTAGGSAIISSGGTAVISGTLQGSVSNQGTLKGNGTINGTLSLGTNSSTEPGNNGTGTITIGGNLSMQSTAALQMQVSSGTNSADKLKVAGTLALNGILNVSPLSGTPAIGREYQLFEAASITGTFSTINLPQLPAGSEWNISELYTTGKISVVESTGLHAPTFNTLISENPTYGLFHISTDRAIQALHVEVYNMQGKELYKQIENNMLHNFEIDLTAQPDGIYLLRLSAAGEKAAMLKLIKK